VPTDAQAAQAAQLIVQTVGKRFRRRFAARYQQTHACSDAQRDKLDAIRQRRPAMSRPTVVLFDVNETLSDLEPLRTRFEEVGAPGHLLETWFASTLRDGIALAAAGAYADFRSVALGVLQGLLAGVEGLRSDPGHAVEHVLAGFGELDVHPDVHDGIRRLADAGVRMATLTNGAAEVAEDLLERTRLANLVERFLSVDEVRRWKPAPEPYLHAARELGVPPEQCALVGVHPWDIDGAKRAGLKAVWLNRRNVRYPDFFETPDAIDKCLGALAHELTTDEPPSPA
jgi:2-haloacid dehalogenase